MKYNEINWKKVLLKTCSLFFPVPVIMIGAGILLLNTIDTFNNYIDNNIVSEQISNNKLFVFIIMNMGIMCVLFGLVWVRLNFMDDTSKTEDYIIKK